MILSTILNIILYFIGIISFISISLLGISFLNIYIINKLMNPTKLFKNDKKQALFFIGIATDFCVNESVKDALKIKKKYNNKKIYIIEDVCRGVDPINSKHILKEHYNNEVIQIFSYDIAEEIEDLQSKNYETNLIVIDTQNDFIEGSLAVDNTNEIIPKINNLLQEDFIKIYFSLDWHPYNHTSFKKYGGLWPKHCVKNTWGSKIHKDIKYNSYIHGTIYKGTNKNYEQYSALSKDNIYCNPSFPICILRFII